MKIQLVGLIAVTTVTIGTALGAITDGVSNKLIGSDASLTSRQHERDAVNVLKAEAGGTTDLRQTGQEQNQERSSWSDVGNNLRGVWALLQGVPRGIWWQAGDHFQRSSGMVAAIEQSAPATSLLDGRAYEATRAFAGNPKPALERAVESVESVMTGSDGYVDRRIHELQRVATTAPSFENGVVLGRAALDLAIILAIGAKATGRVRQLAVQLAKNNGYLAVGGAAAVWHSLVGTEVDHERGVSKDQDPREQEEVAREISPLRFLSGVGAGMAWQLGDRGQWLLDASSSLVHAAPRAGNALLDGRALETTKTIASSPGASLDTGLTHTKQAFDNLDDRAFRRAGEVGTAVSTAPTFDNGVVVGRAITDGALFTAVAVGTAWRLAIVVERAGLTGGVGMALLTTLGVGPGLSSRLHRE